MRYYPQSAVERAMKVQEVILRAISGEIRWIEAARILRMSARSLRRWKERYEEYGYDGLLDRRTGTPSPRKAPFKEVEKILKLYREKYLGFNVRHFHEIAESSHGVSLSYTFVKKALQEAGLVKKKRKRGPHRRRRERKACPGEMLHLDGSAHAWLGHAADRKQTMIVVADDATGSLLYSQLWPGESTESVMAALWEVVDKLGIPMSLYTDRASWAFHTPKAGGKVDKENLTQVGRALARLGIEHIPAYSPQARGRSERLNRTLQDRLINELKAAKITTVEEANRYLRERFIPNYNKRFAISPRDLHSVFVQAEGVDLNQVFCTEEPRTVAKDNTVTMHKVSIQLDKQPGRAGCAGLKVMVRRHLDGSHSVWRGCQLLGVFDAAGQRQDRPRKHSLRNSTMRTLHVPKKPVSLTC